MRSLDRLVGDLQGSASELARQLDEKKYAAARESVRATMRAAGQMLQRLTVLAEMEGEDLI